MGWWKLLELLCCLAVRSAHRWKAEQWHTERERGRGRRERDDSRQKPPEAQRSKKSSAPRGHRTRVLSPATQRAVPLCYYGSCNWDERQVEEKNDSPTAAGLRFTYPRLRCLRRTGRFFNKPRSRLRVVVDLIWKVTMMLCELSARGCACKPRTSSSSRHDPPPSATTEGETWAAAAAAAAATSDRGRRQRNDDRPSRAHHALHSDECATMQRRHASSGGASTSERRCRWTARCS